MPLTFSGEIFEAQSRACARMHIQHFARLSKTTVLHRFAGRLSRKGRQFARMSVELNQNSKFHCKARKGYIQREHNMK